MSKEQSAGLEGLKRRTPPLVWLTLSAALVVVGGASTCGVEDAAFESCDNTGDCDELPGTLCMDEICTCPRAGEQYCEGQCRPAPECWPKAGAGGGAGDAGAPCETAEDCPQPGDAHCGTATCVEGVCGLLLKPLSKLTSQVRGDCRQVFCDGSGNLVFIEDSGDAYNDGSQCSLDVCEMGQPTQKNYFNGSICPETGQGVCFEGECVACLDNFANCPSGYSCDGVVCVAMHCENNVWDQGLGETDFNCGGPCRPCASSGDKCKVHADCLEGVCKFGTCQLPTCSDGVQNDSETDIDCGGGPSCSRCNVGQGCELPSDCQSNVCWAGICEPPKCNDGIRNGDETDWDCGGSCEPCP